VRELTGSARAGFVAGLLYAFAPYRIGQFSHLQVLSSQWMPFALYGFRRYFDTRRAWPLAGAAFALVLQNWSCGYFLITLSVYRRLRAVRNRQPGSMGRPPDWLALGDGCMRGGGHASLPLPYVELPDGVSASTDRGGAGFCR
jgi:hypothetical protein